MTTILLSAPYMLLSLERFQPFFDRLGMKLLTPEVHECLTEEGLLKFAGQFDGAICGDDKYTAGVLEKCAPRLKVISKWGTGIDSIDAQACDRLNIQLYRTPNAFTLPVADSVMAYILAFARRQPWMDIAVKSGAWQKLPSKALHECTLGIIGVGNIGKALARRAHAFGMHLLGNDIVDIDHVFITETGIKMTSFKNLLASSDFVSVNCDLNPTSYHLINAQALKQMRRSTILINTARGPIVDEAALISALQKGIITGAALDVFEIEPLPADSPLMKMDQVLLAPHNSNSSPAAWERVHRNTLRNLVQGLGMIFDEMLFPKLPTDA